MPAEFLSWQHREGFFHVSYLDYKYTFKCELFFHYVYLKFGKIYLSNNYKKKTKHKTS